MPDQKSDRIGFIGFGEVAGSFSQRVKELGGDVIAYDKSSERVIKKAEELEIPLARNMEDLALSSRLILSAVWPHAAMEVAKEAASFLSPRNIYCDVNSISPETTQEIQDIISPSGADFVKIAIMAAIPDRGYAVPLLAGGHKAKEVSEFLTPMGFNIRAMGTDPRQPAAMKILRSVCLKGVIALAYEMLMGADKYGIADQIMESASEVMSRASFKDILGNWLASTAIHGKRRAQEMDEVIVTLKALGIDPVMSTGTKKIFTEIADFGLDEVFKGQIPGSFHAVLEKIAELKSART